MFKTPDIGFVSKYYHVSTIRYFFHFKSIRLKIYLYKSYGVVQ